jgi:hypothetical protein
MQTMRISATPSSNRIVPTMAMPAAPMPVQLA